MTKTLMAALVAAGALSLPLAAQAQDRAPLRVDLQHAIGAALSQNPDIDIAKAQIKQAEAAVRQAEGYRLPQLKLSVTGSRSNDALSAFGIKLGQQDVNFQDFGPAIAADNAYPQNLDTLNHPDAVNNVNTRIEVQMPLYTGGKLQSHADTARAYVRAAQSGDQVARQQLIKHVLVAYQGVHTARAYVTLAEEAKAAAEEYVRISESLHTQGMVVKSDVLSAKANLQDIKVKLTQAKNAEANALNQLALMMSRPLDAPLDVAEPVTPKLLTGSDAELRARARSQHPGLHALRNQVEGAGAQVKAARADKLPQVGVMLRQDWNDRTLGFDASSYTVAGVLSWTAFDGKTTAAAIDRAEASRSELAARLRQAEEGIGYQVTEARRKALEAETAITAREAGVEQAAEAQRLIKKRYENGMATLIEVLTAQAQLDKARADLVAAHFELAVNRTELQRVVGVLTADAL